MDKYNNRSEIDKFVKFHNLMNRNSNIKFQAIVNIDTDFNYIENYHLRVMITFEGYNTLGDFKFYENDLDFNFYPTTCKLDFQEFEFLNNTKLSIKGTHPSTNIDKYQVTILPVVNK